MYLSSPRYTLYPYDISGNTEIFETKVGCPERCNIQAFAMSLHFFQGYGSAPNSSTVRSPLGTKVPKLWSADSLILLRRCYPSMRLNVLTYVTLCFLE